MKKWIELQDTGLWVQGEYLQSQFWIHFNGKTFVIDDETKKSSRSKSSEAAHAADLMAPMPGKVTKILGGLNKEVKKGEAVVVLEAMKMEYTLKAGADGKITKMNCQVGDQVTMGQLLIELKAIAQTSDGGPQ